MFLKRDARWNAPRPTPCSRRSRRYLLKLRRSSASLSAMPAQTNVKAEISALLDRKDNAALKKFLTPWLPADLAPIIADLPIGELSALFRVGSRELAAATFTYMALEAQKKLLKLLTQEQAAALLNALPPDDRTAFLNELPLDLAMQLLSMLTPDERQVAQSLLAYPEHSVGRMMTLDYVAVHPEWSVRESLDYIRDHGYDRETLNIVFVVDDDGHLIDDIRVRRFLLSPLDRPVRELLDGNYSWLAPTDDREKALAVFRKFDRVALPVVDDQKKIIGIVTFDDMLDVAEAEATEDIQKMGGSEALDEPYISISLPRMVKKRASWLVILFLSEMLTTTAMTSFQEEIDKATVLSLFLPLILSSGGNSGSQGSTLVIRALALGEFRLREWWKVLRREIVAGAALGLILGTIGFLRIAIWSGYFAWRHEANPYGGENWPLIGATVGTSVIGTVLWGSLMGTMLPLIIKKLGFDPATSSAPFVATLVDVTGVIIYFSMAMLILRGTLL
jgi:magnesium transporter